MAKGVYRTKGVARRRCAKIWTLLLCVTGAGGWIGGVRGWGGAGWEGGGIGVGGMRAIVCVPKHHSPHSRSVDLARRQSKITTPENLAFGFNSQKPTVFKTSTFYSLPALPTLYTAHITHCPSAIRLQASLLLLGNDMQHANQPAISTLPSRHKRPNSKILLDPSRLRDLQHSRRRDLALRSR